ncbi:MAG TPA: M48 family metallopeptidase [Candidatus Levybacteria bacterium]|nr:M48 family metallopeptidase [Candidatus Levybacteria bacterium]
MKTPYDIAAANKRKTVVIFLFFIILAVTVAYIMGQALGYNGLSIAGVFLILSGIWSFVSYYYSDSLILTMSGAKPATREHHFAFYTAVENLCIASGLPMPKLYVIEDSAPNAFATGRDPKHAVVAATTGLLHKLRAVEVEAVVAHELSHIKNYDTRILGVVTILAGSIALLSDIFLRSLWFRGDKSRNGSQLFMILGIGAAILAPIAATIMQLAISRKREFLADADGALLTRYPEGLASALEKIAKDNEKLKTASVATAHLYIENPFKSGEKKNSWIVGLFSTHPPVEERIKILRSM